VLKTPWGEPDLQGLWTDETDTPLQRPAKYADQEFFTETQRAGLDVQRAALGGKDNRAERGTELDASPVPTTTFSYPGSAPARARRGLWIRPMAGFQRWRRRLRRWPRRSGNIASS